MFSCPTTSQFSLSKTVLTAVLTASGLMGGAVRHVLVCAKSTIFQQINCKTNRNIILNLQSWQGKKWEQYSVPVLRSSLKSLSSTHDEADCYCGTDRLWTITSDVFMDFQCDPIWNIAAVSAKNALYRTALPGQDLGPYSDAKSRSRCSVMDRSQSKCVYRRGDLFLWAFSGFVYCYCSPLQIYWLHLNICKKKMCASVVLGQICDCCVGNVLCGFFKDCESILFVRKIRKISKESRYKNKWAIV